MKKILLIIAITLCIFQMVVLATAIDIGNAAINRDFNSGPDSRVDANNPANASGKITSVEIYVYEAMTGLEFATFYVVSGNNLSTRDNVSIGNVAVGYNQFDVNLNVVEGDFIGMYYITGKIDRDNTVGTGSYLMSGDQIPCENVTFSLIANIMLSIYGTGATIGWPHKWNTITIGKWNTKEFTKWNDLE